MQYNKLPDHISLSNSVEEVLAAAPSICIVDTLEDLVALALPDDEVDAQGFYEVAYEANGERMVEARVCRVRNGVSANYLDPYMRRRDPDCMFIADTQETDKPVFQERFGYEFSELREATLDWLKKQDLVCFFFEGGVKDMGLPGVAICPANAGFFALGLGMLQGIIPLDSIKADYFHDAVIYVAPPFRHTHFKGKQVVVHNRRENLHELFSYNLYP